MPILYPDARLELPGVVVRSAGVGSSSVEARVVLPDLTRGPLDDVASSLDDAGVGEVAADRVASALDAAGLHTVLVVPFDDISTGGDGQGRPRRGTTDGPSLELEVEQAGPEEGQVVLEVDGTGVMTWHYPQPAESLDSPDRAPTGQIFRIPVRQLDVPEETGATRGLGGIGIKKVLHLLRYPIERILVDGAVSLIAAWENRARPHRLQCVGASGFAAASPLQPTDWARLAQGPALLFVHGTFSTSAAAFTAVGEDRDLMADLLHRYGGRVLAFDHPSIHVDPLANATWLLQQLPPELDLSFDVVCHSRGGLVSRALTSPGVVAEAGRQAPAVGSLIHVASANAGTALADVDRFGDLIDVMTNLAALFPDDAVSVPFTAVLECVKQVATGVADQLVGLTAMTPGSEILRGLSADGAAGHGASRQFGLSSDFTPAEAAGLPVKALNVLVDSWFAEGNDLVVPTDGVTDVPGPPFVDSWRVPTSPPVTHLGFFGDESVRRKLAGWLPPGTP